MRGFNIVLLVTVVGALGFALFQKSPAPAGKREPPLKAAADFSPHAEPRENATGAPLEGDVLEGEALEVIDVPSYTYIRIGEKGGVGTWAAVSSAPIAKGSRVRVVSETKMVGFRSEKLERTFDEIHFGALEGAPGQAIGNTMTATVGANPHGGARPSADVPVGKVDKASGPSAFRIAEVHAQKQKLAGRSVRVRGVVVKSTSGVLGKTFMHLRDGTGDAKSANNDLTVTTPATATVGETLTVEGTVSLEKDLGAGYRYEVIIEDARLSK
jgi:hypothetical protein